jgi:ribosome-binding factor A
LKLPKYKKIFEIANVWVVRKARLSEDLSGLSVFFRAMGSGESSDTIIDLL